MNVAAASSYGENLVVAAVYAREAAPEGRPREVLWSADSAYDAVAALLMARLDFDLNTAAGPAELESHRLLQAEVRRQNADIETLVVCHDVHEAGKALPSQAKADASLVFGVDWDTVSED